MKRNISSELKTALHSHARRVHAQGLAELRPYPEGILITYGDLCSLAGDPVIPRGAGKYLTDLAANERKPIDALVVARRTGLPGSKYGSSGTLNRTEWERDARSALTTLLAKV